MAPFRLAIKVVHRNYIPFGVLERRGTQPICARAALGILEEEFDLKIPEDFRADYPHAAADILQRKARPGRRIGCSVDRTA